MSTGVHTGADSVPARIALGIALALYALLGLSKVYFSVLPHAEK